MTTKFEDCCSMLPEEQCRKFEQYERQTTRRKLMSEFEDEEDLITKAKLAGVSWVKLVTDLTKQILEEKTVLLMAENLQLKAEIAAVRQQIEERGFTVNKSGTDVKPDWRAIMRSSNPPGTLW